MLSKWKCPLDGRHKHVRVDIYCILVPSKIPGTPPNKEARNISEKKLECKEQDGRDKKGSGGVGEKDVNVQ